VRSIVIPHLDVDTQGDYQIVLTEQLSPQLYEFFQRILDTIIKNPEFQSAIPNLGTADEVLMEILVDGVRYTLHHSTSRSVSLPVSLSPREREIVRLVAKGLPNKVIAITLEVSPWTICTHLRRIFSKLGVRSRAEMVASALKNNLLEGK